MKIDCGASSQALVLEAYKDASAVKPGIRHIVVATTAYGGAGRNGMALQKISDLVISQSTPVMVGLKPLGQRAPILGAKIMGMGMLYPWKNRGYIFFLTRNAKRLQ